MTLPGREPGRTAEAAHPVETALAELRAQVHRLEEQVRVLAEANVTLARGLEAGPLEEAGQSRPEHAARLAHELLLAAGLVVPETGAESGRGTGENTAQNEGGRA